MLGWGPLIVVRGIWCQALSLSSLPVLGLGASALLLMSTWRGWCGCGDPALAPQCALLRAGVRALGVDRGRLRGGGAPRTVVRGVWGQALSLPLLLVLWARGGGPLPTCCGRGPAGVGTRQGPFGVRALLGAACRGGGESFPLGRGPLTVVTSVWCQALSLSPLPVLGAGRRALLPILVGRR